MMNYALKQKRSFSFVSEDRIEEVKKEVQQNKWLRLGLEKRAEMAMEQEPLSVTFHPGATTSGDIHDYYSEGIYWWPNPEDPNGPYIRRDGEINPNLFTNHKKDLNLMSETVAVLAQAGLFLEKEQYHRRAVELLKVWFLDPETCVNPHLEYAQAIKGICDGREIGIIDTVELIGVIYGIELIESCNPEGYQTVFRGLREWFSSYLKWMTTSQNGLKERDHNNNHANWWNTQVAALSSFVGDVQLLETCFQRFTEYLLPSQTNTDGSFADELTRTRSYTYTIFSLEASAILCEIARNWGVDLWHVQLEEGKGMGRSVAFFKPFYQNPFLWKAEQIGAENCFREVLAMKLAALRLEDAELERENINRRADIFPCSQMCHLGILDLI